MNKVIIHIDADAQQRTMVRHLFERRPVTVEAFASLQEAQARLNDPAPYAVLVTEMPASTDEQEDFVSGLLQLCHSRGARLVLLTESQIPETLELFRAKGIDGWFTKPAQRNHFFETLLSFMQLPRTTG